jgi:hypothetical protein
VAPFLLVPVLLAIVCEREATSRDVKEVPFPTSRTTVVRDPEVLYVVDGRQRIPPGIEITGQKGIRLRGRNNAVLEVRGALVMHGVGGSEIQIDGVRIELPEEVQQLHLDLCKLDGGSGVVTPPDKTTSGSITIENCDFQSEPGIDIAVTSGKVKFMSLNASKPVRLRGVDINGKANKVYGSIRTCNLDSLVVENVADLTVRHCKLKGPTLKFSDNRILVFDGNRVEAATLIVEHARAGFFKKTKVTKCDLLCGTIRFFAPADPKKSDRVIFDKCWFAGEMDLEKIAEVIEDAEDDPKNNVKITLKKPMKRRHGFADG